MKIIYNNGEVADCPEEEELHVLRHSASHIMAHAIKRLYPQVHFAFGPATENGFYYDIDLEGQKLSDEDLANIEAEMHKICKENLPIRPFTLNRSEAISLLKNSNESYKVEHINELPLDNDISFYQQGEYIDMCIGPHLAYTKSLKAFKITQQSGAYWRGDKKNKMLTRISGIAFRSNKELEQHIKLMEEVSKRDHRKIGKEMELFMTSDFGLGFPFFLPNGLIIKNALIDYWREIHTRENYIEISTPLILDQHLWETSGHWFHYRDNMYTTQVEENNFVIKPMNCPGGLLVYKNSPHSYRDLPIRCGELGVVHRHELKGALHGLFRVRCFTQDDAHIFMTKDQILDEIKGVTKLIDEVYARFGFKYHVELSTRPESSMGSDSDWEEETNGLQQALNELGLEYIINEGDGAFYGPKIDFHLEDSIGRTWQCGTIQLDFQLPQNFELEYIDENNQPQRPIMIHRVVYGSIERFLGILTEHYAGKFPTWLAPVQVKVLAVSEKTNDYATEVYNTLRNAKIRCVLDTRNEKIGYKIREAQQVERVPYMLILGTKESESASITIRKRDSSNYFSMSLSEFIFQIQNEIDKRISL